jgi:hypothetical protein
MKTSNANKHRGSIDPAWQFIAEFPLNELLSDHDKGGELTAGLLFKMMLEMGIPLEYLEDIEMTLTGFAKEALVHFKRGGLELPERIRVFCQKKIIDNAYSAKTSRPYDTEQVLEHAQFVYPTDTKINGGWGYFLIERGGNVSTGTSASSWNSVDLYLYKEGE